MVVAEKALTIFLNSITSPHTSKIKSNQVYLDTTFFENDSGVFTVQEINLC